MEALLSGSNRERNRLLRAQIPNSAEHAGCVLSPTSVHSPTQQLYPAMDGSISGSWYPVIDGNLFPEHPTKLLAIGQYHETSMIDSVNPDEGAEHVILQVPHSRAYISPSPPHLLSPFDHKLNPT